MSLKEYQHKRNFKKTPEPKGGPRSEGEGQLRFFVQMHRANRLHFDLRLEFGGTLKSWAIPKGPSLSPLDQRLAVFVEDHPLDYGNFEGVIPRGNYGAGTVLLWDRGTFVERTSSGRIDSEKALHEGLSKGKITVVLDGIRLKGEFALVQLKDGKNWLFIKKRDEWAKDRHPGFEPLSVKSGRTIEEIAENAPSKGEIWESSQKIKGESRVRIRKEQKEKARKTPTKEKFPRRIKPMLATSIPELPQGKELKGYGFESDYGGKRAIAEIHLGRVNLYSKSLLSYNDKHPEIVSALKGVKKSLVLDGEIMGKNYIVFDLLHENGKNLRDLSLKDRKLRLKKLKIFGPEIKYKPHASQPEKLKEEGVGLWARDLKSVYRSGTSGHWVKYRTKGVSPARARQTHRDRIYFPKDGITKGDLIDYYNSISDYILPHLKDRPQSLNRHPEGIEGESFFHKDHQGYLPRFVRTHSIASGSSGRSMNYLLCQNHESLLFMANLGCIEINPWFSRVGSLDRPDFAVIDLDPDGNPFNEVREVALAIHEELDSRNIAHFPKTSGSRGIHIAIPLGRRFTYDQTRSFCLSISQIIRDQFKQLTSLERSPAKRRKKIYLDCFQNRRSQTLASVYCVRPRPGAPVSTPLHWFELKKPLKPEDFHIRNTLKRLENEGDLFAEVLVSDHSLKLSDLRAFD